jgi:hypothetical protein
MTNIYIANDVGNAASTAVATVMDDGKGMRFRRLNMLCAEREFFISHDNFKRSNWVLAPAGMQLEFL